MRLVKEINATIPTVAYGNVDLLTRIEYDSETDEAIVMSDIRRYGGILDKAVAKEWATLHDFVEAHLKSRIASLEHDKPKKTR